MNTNDLFRKISSWEELSKEEKLQVAKESISRKDNTTSFEKMLSWEEIPLEEKIEIARSLIADKVADILQKEMVISHISWERSKLTLTARQCKDSDESLRRFLRILWAKDIKVTSDFPCWYGWENYEWTTTIEFNY